MLLILSGDVEICPGPEPISREEFIHFLSKRGLKMVHQNVQGLRKNFDLIQEFITTHKDIDIFGMSETHFNDNDPNNFCVKYRDVCFIKEMFYQRTNGSGGRVGIYVKESLKLKRRADLEHTNVECLC